MIKNYLGYVRQNSQRESIWNLLLPLPAISSCYISKYENMMFLQVLTYKIAIRKSRSSIFNALFKGRMHPRIIFGINLM